jgi:hypothetical protein
MALLKLNAAANTEIKQTGYKKQDDELRSRLSSYDYYRERGWNTMD